MRGFNRDEHASVIRLSAYSPLACSADDRIPVGMSRLHMKSMDPIAVQMEGNGVVADLMDAEKAWVDTLFALAEN